MLRAKWTDHLSIGPLFKEVHYFSDRGRISMSEKIETPKSATSASLDDARRKMYWPLKPEEGGGYFLWRQFDAELATKMSEFFVGGLYQREVISKRERQLYVVAALTVLRCEDELRAHIHAARNLGVTQTEIAEVIFQMLTYGG